MQERDEAVFKAGLRAEDPFAFSAKIKDYFKFAEKQKPAIDDEEET